MAIEIDRVRIGLVPIPNEVEIDRIDAHRPIGRKVALPLARRRALVEKRCSVDEERLAVDRKDWGPVGAGHRRGVPGAPKCRKQQHAKVHLWFNVERTARENLLRLHARYRWRTASGRDRK